VTRFGDYVLEERLAVGGMAEVFRAVWHGEEGFQRSVAIKRILPGLSENEDFIKMFIDEAKIAVRLSHPNIAQIIDLGMEGDTYYIALEYVPGRDMRSVQDRVIERGRGALPLPLAIHVVMKVCEALHHAHGAQANGQPLGLIHRDVSPQNILISYEGEVKVIDFGLAKAAGRMVQTRVGVVKGKLAYLSPEQARGLSIDHRSDIFSLGICFFEWITGQRLFLRAEDADTVMAVQRGEVPRIDSLPGVDPMTSGELEPILRKALAPDPAQRYQSALELHDALQAFCYEHRIIVTRSKVVRQMSALFAEEAKAELVRGGRAEAAPDRPRRPSRPRAPARAEPPPPPAPSSPAGSAPNPGALPEEPTRAATPSAVMRAPSQPRIVPPSFHPSAMPRSGIEEPASAPAEAAIERSLLLGAEDLLAEIEAATALPLESGSESQRGFEPAPAPEFDLESEPAPEPEPEPEPEDVRRDTVPAPPGPELEGVLSELALGLSSEDEWSDDDVTTVHVPAPEAEND